MSGPHSAGEERPPEQPGDEQELAAARRQAADLAEQLEAAEKRHRRELEELREEMGRELMRRSFAAADREWARRGPGSPATLVAAEYEATTSWRLTRPLRALGRLLRRDR
jgi:rubrerythrin